MGEPHYKTVSGDITIKDEAKGEVECVFATLNQIDHDGDVTLPGAFKEGQTVAISQHGHTIWDGTAPVGKGTIKTRGNDAVFSGQFFMDMAAARDTFHAVKGMGEHGQWSYGFKITECKFGEFADEEVKFLTALDVFEVSPVLRGAGIGTRTTSVKQDGIVTGRSSVQLQPEGGSVVTVPAWQAIKTHETATTTKRWTPFDPAGLVGAVRELRAKHAAVDLTKDPEDPAAYLFDHHDAYGAANMRQCVIHIARINGAKGAPSLPDDVAEAVYGHLADHLRDGDLDAPSFRGGVDGKLKFFDHAAVTLADLSGLNDRAQEVVRLRAQNRKATSKRVQKATALSSVSAVMLEWIYDEMRKMRSLIDTPQEALEQEHLRYLREAFLRDNPPGDTA